MPNEITFEPNLRQPDEFYAMLLAAHERLTKVQSDALNARLILILANQIDDPGVLAASIDAASKKIEEK